MEVNTLKQLDSMIQELEMLADGLSPEAKSALGIISQISKNSKQDDNLSLTPQEASKIVESLDQIINNSSGKLGSAALSDLRSRAASLGLQLVKLAESSAKSPEYKTTSKDKANKLQKFLATGRLVEAVGGSSGSRWAVVLLESGMSKNRHFYPEEVLKKACDKFQGVKAFVDHPSVEERKQLPERSVRDIAGWFENIHFSNNKLVGELVISEGQAWLKDMLVDAYNKGKEDLVGLSIFAEGRTRLERQNGQVYWLVENIERVDSVDIVTEPAAGGRFQALLEADRKEVSELEMFDKLTLEELERVRPDLIQALEAKLKKKKTDDEKEGDYGYYGYEQPDEKKKKKGVVKEAEAVVEAEGNSVIAETKNTIATTLERLQKAACNALLRESLDSSELPDPVKEKLMEQFKDRIFTAEELDKAIATEKKVLSKLIEAPKFPYTVKARDMVSEQERFAKAMDGMFQGKPIDGVQPFRSLKEAYAVYKGISVTEVDPLQILRESTGYSSSKRLVESVTTGTWTEVLGDSITRQMLREYRLPNLDDWRKICSSITRVNDFRTQRRIRLGGYGLLPEVGEGETYTNLSSPSDEEITYNVKKHGGLEELTIETIANDDLGAVRQIPIRLARAAKVTLFRYVFNLLTSNPVQPDGKELFHTDHNNLLDQGLSSASLTIARRMMREQTAYGSATEFLQITPRYILVPNELEMVAKLLRDNPTNPDPVVLANGGTAVAVSQQTNVHRGTFDIIVVDHWTEPSDWYLVADPQLCNTIELAFFGSEEPELVTQDQPNVGSLFTADKIFYKIRHIYGGAVLDWRSFLASKPA